MFKCLLFFTTERTFCLDIVTIIIIIIIIIWQVFLEKSLL